MRFLLPLAAFVRDFDPTSFVIRRQHVVGGDLSVKSIIKTGNGVMLLGNRRDEFPNHIISKDRRGFTFTEDR